MPGPAREDTREPPVRWLVLALVSAALLPGMSVWFTATAVAPGLRDLWGLGPAALGWLTTVVQVGFVVGTAAAAFLNLADLVPARTYFTTCALAAAGANAALVAVPGFPSALLVRFLTGFFLAGVYPTSMKMISTWFKSGRGLAIGTVVGALTVGKAGPYLLSAIGGADLETVVLGASAASAAGALLIAVGYRDGPFPFERRPFSVGLVSRILRHRETMLATGGYLGHMWELYAAWAAWGLFFFELFGDAVTAAIVTFFAIGVGGPGAVLAGQWADRWGREWVAGAAMVASGLCALVMGWLISAPTPLVVAVSLVWGFTVVADSAQFSALVTEVAPAHAVGTALTLQTAMGFALTAGSMWLVSAIAPRFGWGPAFSLLAIGPVFGILSLVRLRAVRRNRSPASEP